MSIQSSLNSMLTTAGYLGGIMKSLSYQKEVTGALTKQTELQE